jgi:DNA-binding MarR family transcriptional regulator
MSDLETVGILDETETRDGSLPGEVRASVARLHRRLRQERPPHELGMTAMSVLSSLHRLGPAGPSQLAERERVQPQTMTRTLATLEKRGLVRRSAHPTDGRATVISITDAGHALIHRDRQQRDEWLGQAMRERLSEAEREILAVAAKLLDQLSAPLD